MPSLLYVITIKSIWRDADETWKNPYMMNYRWYRSIIIIIRVQPT